MTTRYATALLAALVVGAPSVAAQETSFSPTQDATVRAGDSADTNFGAEEDLRVRGFTSETTPENNKRAVYLQFDLSSYTGAVGTATLKLTVDRAVSSGVNDGLGDRADFYATTDGFEEASVTWNNGPARGEELFERDFARQLEADPDSTYEFDVTEYVRSEVAGDRIVSFYIYDDKLQGTDLRFYSKEATSGPGPELVVSTMETAGESGPGGSVAVHAPQPNPFRTEARVEFELARAGEIDVAVFDLLGRRVRTLQQGPATAGAYTVVWDGRSDAGSAVASGLYVLRFDLDGDVRTARVSFLR